ncbi:hypothetical protein [Romboutsia sp. MSSM.1001216sp_RTP31141st1_G3_RTP31141_220114]|uniref:hypothetical protein n=1 Tax=unclassified Romboutsia TaxID=2626894 RepID=UPI0031B572A0
MNIGTKIYYCNITGNVLVRIGDLTDFPRNTTFDEDYSIYVELSERNKETISLIQLEYGEYEKLAKNKICTGVNLETKELIFSNISIPNKPSKQDLLEERVKTLEDSQVGQDALLDSTREAVDFLLLSSESL